MAFVSVQAEEVTKSVTFSSYTAGTQYAQNEKHDLGDGLVIYTTECHFTSELRIYSSSTHNGYVVSDALPGAITKMTFNAGNKVDVLVVSGSNDGDTWTVVGEVSVTSTSYKDYSLNFSGSYKRFKIDVKGANQVRLKSMSVTYSKDGTEDVETVATPTITAESETFKLGESLSVTIETETDGAEIYYTLDGSDPVENGDLYEGEIKLTNTTTVKAVAMLEGWNNSEVVEAKFTAIDPNAKEVEANISFASTTQRTVQDSDKQVWSNGGVTFTNNKASSTNAVANYYNPVRLYANSNIVVECSLGNITSIAFDCNSISYASALKNSIGDAATVSSKKVTVTLDGSSNSFTIAKLTAQVQLDALTVTYVVGVTKPVTPTLTATCNFVGSMMVEISCETEGAAIYYTTDGTEPTDASTEYTASFEITDTTTVKAIAVNEAGESSIATATYTRVAATPEISFAGATFEEYVEVTIAAAEGTTAYYTLNGKAPTENSDECPETLTIKADATLQVIAYDEDGYASRVVKQTFQKATSGSEGASTGTATLVKDVADLTIGDQVVIVASGHNYALSTAQNTNNRGSVEITKEGNDVVLNDGVQILTLENGAKAGQFAFQTGEGYLYAASTTANHLKTSTTLNNKASFTIGISNGVATIKADQDERNWLRFNSTNNPKIFSCYTSGQADVSIYKVNLEDYILNVTEAGWATLYLGYNVVIPEAVTCYVISEIGEEKVQLEEVSGILPANTAVIVNAEEGEYAFEVSGDEAGEFESNMLGTTKSEYFTEEAYVLGIVGGEVGLYKAEMKGGVWLNNAYKAYLPATEANKVSFYGFIFDEEENTTGIEVVENANENVIYDLAGRRVSEITEKGIYIVNGKKVIK